VRFAKRKNTFTGLGVFAGHGSYFFGFVTVQPA
jgi:hypothetical protein